ncbi:MAG: hypothetical protein GX608_10035 [Lentisphaerae bacterium]|nr:hypothetical protein [Lentisphaerota bacterium]
MRTAVAFLFGLSVAVTGGCNETKSAMTKYEPDRPHYFAGAKLKNYPVRVYAPIGPDRLSDFTNAYYEAHFDDRGRVVVLRKLLRDSEVWKTTYLYHESGAVKEERWNDSSMATVRFFSSDGKLIREEKTPPASGGASKTNP